MAFPKKCDCCGFGVIKEPWEICEICGWEDDALQRKDPGFSGGANALSLNEHLEKFLLEYTSERESEKNDTLED